MNVSAHAGVTLKKTNKQTNNQMKKYSKTNNERVHRYCSFWISSIALLGWISETRKKKSRKPQKFTLTHQMKHRRVLSSRTCGFSFASAKPTRWKYLKILITFSTAHLFFHMLQYCYYRGELPINWHSRPRGCPKLYFEPYWWNESDFALGWEVITFYQNPRHLTSPKMLMSEKKVTIALR